MDKEIAESIGLLRHQIISPVLMESTRAQVEYFRRTAEREFDVPGRGPRKFTVTTMKSWLSRYRRNGFAGITPKTRSDCGVIRALSAESRAGLKALRLEHLELSCVKFYERALEAKLLGDPPICIETLRRFLKIENLYKIRTVTPRKRFEMSYFGELWTCDFMHGPMVLESDESKRRKKAILLAIIDDHSRLIVGHAFGFIENTRLIELVFKDAILAHGLPDRLYCDNGSAFSSHCLSRVCAHLNIGLVHSKPYDSPSRGKIERFFRTVRENFLVDVKEDANWNLERLNNAFSRWIREHYHMGQHHGIQARPIDRHQISIRNYPRRRVAAENLEEFFLVTVDRTVNKDCTVSFNGIYYEVPPQFIGRRVELKFAQDSVHEVYLYDNGARITRIHPVDSRLNGKTFYQPGSRISDVALHEIATTQSVRGGEIRGES